MINKVPKEELNALFEEIFDNKNINLKSTDLKKKDIKGLYKFYGYKLKSIFNSTLADMSSIPIIIKDFTISNYDNNVKKAFLGIDFEKKYRVFFDIDEQFIKNIENYSKSIQLEKNYPLRIVQNIIENLADNLLKEINLNSEKLSNPYTHFFDQEVIEFKYECFLEDKSSYISIYLEKNFLESEVLGKWIYSKPTSQEIIKINKLKSLLRFDLEIISQPINIDLTQNNIKLSDMKFNIQIK
ncbi:hypothetical protein [Hydrogenothermus marinus]|uniref:Uncharacterized protein n=1 Tax=Hydrogenothermus marinus TaxID=133270 RepID=A0A3M0C467_9AQUI|nr:hypothetical protein [Hydrogenothermus marinus]RMA97762.1 hypothetical protein CLV39_0389 [Hydrogenothermus marinus]